MESNHTHVTERSRLAICPYHRQGLLSFFLAEVEGLEPPHRYSRLLAVFKTAALPIRLILPCTGIYLIVSPKFIPKLLSGYLGATQPPYLLKMKGQPYSLSCTDKFFNIFKAYVCTSNEGGIST